jgi:hypothetical protein
VTSRDGKNDNLFYSVHTATLYVRVYFFKFTEYLFRNIGKKEKLQDIHNSNEADRFILALFMSHVLI